LLKLIGALHVGIVVLNWHEVAQSGIGGPTIHSADLRAP
jgi:hypothetical protein